MSDRLKALRKMYDEHLSTPAHLDACETGRLATASFGALLDVAEAAREMRATLNPRNCLSLGERLDAALAKLNGGDDD